MGSYGEVKTNGKDVIESLRQKLISGSSLGKLVEDMALALKDLQEGSYSFPEKNYEGVIDSFLIGAGYTTKSGNLTQDGERIYRGLKTTGFYDAYETHARELTKG